MEADYQLYLSLGYCALMLVLSWLFNRFKPKKINSLYGYRTPKSMKSQESWEAANKQSSWYMLKLSLYCFALPFLGYALWPAYNLLVTLVVHSLLLMGIIFFVERYLKEHFDQEGNPK